MKIKNRITALLGAGLMFGLCQSSNATPTPGTYTYGFSGNVSTNVWDISGTYDDIGLAGLLDGDFTMSVDSKGKVTGSGDASFSGAGTSIDINIIVNGKVKTTSSVTTATLKVAVKGKGSIDFGGENYQFSYSGSFKYNLTINQTENRMSGIVTGGLKFNVKGLGSERISVNDINGGDPITFSAILPNQMDGSWTLTVPLSVDEKGKPVIGEVTASLSNGRQIVMNGKASYKLKTDETKISLKGSNPASKGNILKIVAEGDNLDITGQKGKLLGQKFQ